MNVGKNGKIWKLTDLRNYFTLSNNSRQRLESLLSQQAEQLIRKKSYQQKKKQRVRRVEESYEEERQRRRMLINGKMKHSEDIRELNRSEISRKWQKKMQKHERKINKIRKDNQMQVQQSLSAREEFTESISKQKDKRIMSSTTHHLSVFNRPNTLYDIAKRLGDNQKKQRKAYINSILYKRKIISRAQSQNKSVAQVQQKFKSLEQDHKAETYRKYYQKADTISRVSLRTKQLIQRQTLIHKKQLDERIKKCQENFQHLNNERDERLTGKMKQKMERIIIPRIWKNERATLYRQQFVQNSARIERQKQKRNDNILKKHVQVTMKNKIYKQKKEQIYKAIMIQQ